MKTGILKELPDGAIPTHFVDSIKLHIKTEIQSYAQGRQKDVERGAETPELAALLLEKYALGVTMALNVIGIDFDMAEVDRLITEIDPCHVENRKARWKMHPAGVSMTTTALNPLQNVKGNIDFVISFLVLVAGGVVTEKVKTTARNVLQPLVETQSDLSIVSTVEAFERVPDLQEFAAQLRKAMLPGEFVKYFNPDEYQKPA